MVDDNLLETDRKRYADDVTVQELVRLRVENDKQRDEIERLREALVSLMKVQNGPPLTAWTNDWLEAMKKADAALQQKESK